MILPLFTILFAGARPESNCERSHVASFLTEVLPTTFRLLEPDTPAYQSPTTSHFWPAR